MSQPAPRPGDGGPTPAQIEQMRQAMAAEARRRGMTPEEFQTQQRAQIEAEAKAHGMTPQQYVQKLRADAIANAQRQQQQQGGAQGGQQAGGQQQQQQIPINNTGTPDPRALAVAKWLRSQDIKTRGCILGGQRKDMFRVKRAIRAIQSPAYTKAAEKPKSELPAVTETFPAEEVFKLLPLSLLALRVSKVDADDAAAAKPKKRVKGQWTVRIEQQQDVQPDLHYVFLYDSPSWRTQLYAVGALIAVFAVILFPLWPLKMRIGVWYLSMGMLGLIALFFAMAIFRLILFVMTVFTVPPGLWLYPNLFEDVGFFDSFKPLWGWHETADDKKAARKAKREARKAKSEARATKAGKSGKANSTSHSHSHDHDHSHHDHDHDHDHAEHEHEDDHEDSGDESGDDATAAIPANITVTASTTGTDVGKGGVAKRGMQASVEEGSESD